MAPSSADDFVAAGLATTTGLVHDREDIGVRNSRCPVSPGLLCMLGGAFLFSLMSLLVVYLKDLGTFELVFWRSAFMSMICLSFCLAKGMNPKGPDGRTLLLVLRGVLGFTFMVGYYYALKHLPLSDAVTISYTMPVITAIGAAVLLGEPWEKLDALGSVLCLTGVVLISKPSFVWSLFGSAANSLPVNGLLGAITAAVTSSGVYLLVRVLKGTHPVILVLYFAVVGTLLAPVFSKITGQTWVWPSRNHWPLLILLSVFSVTGEALMTIGLSLETAAKATAMNYVQVVFASIYQVVLLHKSTDWLHILGSALIASWGAIAVVKERKKLVAADSTGTV